MLAFLFLLLILTFSTLLNHSTLLRYAKQKRFNILFQMYVIVYVSNGRKGYNYEVQYKHT